MSTFELVYSRQDSDFIVGRAYSNPRYYSTPRAGVTKVYLVGDWPQIEADYTALGIPVERLDMVDATAVAQAEIATDTRAVALTPTVSGDERDAIYIPDDWANLPWSRPAAGRDLTLRGLAALFSAEPVLNKTIATAAIEAELARRADVSAADGDQ